MKFKGTPRSEVFNPTTTCTLGRYDNNGIFETEDPEIIIQMQREEIGVCLDKPKKEVVKPKKADIQSKLDAKKE